VLLDVAAALQRACRSRDTVGRLGGDEFGVVLRGSSALRWMADVKRSVRRAAEARGIEFAVSIGFAALAGTDGRDEALAAADVALYEAKRAATVQG
jgi:diguanylate cyclase (GGDEF)-like protein